MQEMVCVGWSRVGSFVLRWDGENRCHLRYVPWWSIRHEVVMIVAGGCV